MTVSERGSERFVDIQNLRVFGTRLGVGVFWAVRWDKWAVGRCRSPGVGLDAEGGDVLTYRFR